MRCDGSTLEAIVVALTDAKLRPLKAGRYSITAVQDLLQSAVYHDRSTARGLALYLNEQGHSLREYGVRLAQSGHHPKLGGQWYPQTVKMMMVS